MGQHPLAQAAVGDANALGGKALADSLQDRAAGKHEIGALMADAGIGGIRTIVKMKVIKSRRAPAAAIGAADINVMQAAYSLAKAQSELAAREILQDIPAATYPALAKHMRERPSLFLPAVYDVVVQAIDGRKLSKADALFS